MIFTIIKHNERVTASAESAEERVVRGLDLLERVEALLITVIYSDYSLLFIHVDQHHPSDRAYDLYNNTQSTLSETNTYHLISIHCTPAVLAVYSCYVSPYIYPTYPTYPTYPKPYTYTAGISLRARAYGSTTIRVVLTVCSRVSKPYC